MGLRDIFDSDPRSKGQLREELRLQGEVISDLLRQLDQRNEKLNVSTLEAQALRPKRHADLQHSQGAKIEYATHAPVTNSVNPNRELHDVSAGVLEPTRIHIGRRKEIIQKLVNELGSIRDQRALVQENTALKLYAESLAKERTDLVAKLNGSLDAVGSLTKKLNSLRHGHLLEEPNSFLSAISVELSDQSKPLSDRERLLFKNFAELQRREAILIEAVSTGSSNDLTNTVNTGLSEVSMVAKHQESNNKTQDLKRLIQKLKARLANVQSQLRATDLELTEAKKSVNYFLGMGPDSIRRGVGSIEWEERRGAEQRDYALKSLQYQLDLERLEHKEQVEKLELQAAADSQKLAQLRQNDAQKSDAIDRMTKSVERHLEDIRRLTSRLANSDEEVKKSASQIQSHLSTNARLREEIKRFQQVEDQMTRKFETASRQDIQVFQQEEILTWLFSEIYPDKLRVDHGYLHLMGDGPWDNDAFGRLLAGQDFSLWKLPDADIAHLVVGRNNWSEDDLVAQIEARQGQTLRIYSQEMWFAAMASGRDPFDADDPELLQAFANGHEALEFLIGLEVPWPNLSDLQPDEVNPVEVSELGVLASPMHMMDYRVGKTSPHSEDERRAILHAIFCSKKLPFGDDCSEAYRSNWGAPKSAQRLYRMANHIKFIVDGPNGSDYRKSVARDDWVNDLAWLKKTYFKKIAHSFKWPA